MLCNKKGFTLIELIVVIIIIGILAAIAAPMMSANMDKAKRSEAVAALGSIRTAQRCYRAEFNGAYASGSGALSSYLNVLDLNGKYYNCSDYSIGATSASTTLSYGGTTVGIQYDSGNLNGA